LLDTGNSVLEMPLPVVPEDMWYVTEKPVSVRGSLAWRFFFHIATVTRFTRRFFFRLTIATTFQVAFF